jgi:hypothetical protein
MAGGALQSPAWTYKDTRDYGLGSAISAANSAGGNYISQLGNLGKWFDEAKQTLDIQEAMKLKAAQDADVSKQKSAELQQILSMYFGKNGEVSDGSSVTKAITKPTSKQSNTKVSSSTAVNPVVQALTQEAVTPTGEVANSYNTSVPQFTFTENGEVYDANGNNLSAALLPFTAEGMNNIFSNYNKAKDDPNSEVYYGTKKSKWSNLSDAVDQQNALNRLKAESSYLPEPLAREIARENDLEFILPSNVMNAIDTFNTYVNPLEMYRKVTSGTSSRGYEGKIPDDSDMQALFPKEYESLFEAEKKKLGFKDDLSNRQKHNISLQAHENTMKNLNLRNTGVSGFGMADFLDKTDMKTAMEERKNLLNSKAYKYYEKNYSSDTFDIEKNPENRAKFIVSIKNFPIDKLVMISKNTKDKNMRNTIEELINTKSPEEQEAYYRGVFARSER